MPIKTSKKSKLESEEPRFVKKSLIQMNENIPVAVSKVPKIKKNGEDKKESRKIKNELLEIYENEDGTLPDMKNFQVRKKGGLARAFLVLLFACVVLGTVAWVGFFVLEPKSVFEESDVGLTISGKEILMIGEKVTYRIRYRNQQNVPLSRVNLQVRYPEGFIFENSSQEPTNDKKDEWIIGAIDANDGGYIDVTGKLFGSLGETKSFRVFLNYTPSNFSSEFQKVTNLNLSFGESPIDYRVEKQENINAGQEANLRIILTKKNPEAVISKLAVVVDGSGFMKKKSDPASDAGNELQWTFDDWQGEKIISLTGIFYSPNETSSSSNFVAKIIGLKSKEDVIDDGFAYGEINEQISLNKLALNGVLAINGNLEKGKMEPGEILTMSLKVKNSGLEEIRNFNVKLIIDAPAYKNRSILDWTKILDAKDGNIVGERLNENVRRGIIAWDSTKENKLASFKTGDEVGFDLSMPIKTAEVTELSNFSSSEIKVIAEIEYALNGVKRKISSNQVTLLIQSDLNLKASDKIINDAQEKEIHQITWLLSNTYHELNNLELEADVYGDAMWRAESLNVPAGKVEYDGQNKKIKWTIGSMPLGVDALPMQFSLLLNTKNSSQTQLVSKVKIKALDTVLNEEIIKEGDEVKLLGA